ncbi:MAG TPA: hypothetical protein VFD83_02400, partial [Candidatus Polarisedimenticolia bacterium]|nr:hypothetical protein [Candidatus Polarisedimenticolia bacterium]
ESSARLELLNVRFVREVQALTFSHLTGAFGREGSLLWNQARGVDPSPVRAPEARPRVIAEETLGRETNDSRALAAHVERLACELASGLRARHEGARGITLHVEYADGHEGSARRTFDHPLRGAATVAAAAHDLLERAVKRRVRIRRLRLTAWDVAPTTEQLTLWSEETSRASSLDGAVERARARFGVESLVPATWMLHGLVRAPARP